MDGYKPRVYEVAAALSARGSQAKASACERAAPMSLPACLSFPGSLTSSGHGHVTISSLAFPTPSQAATLSSLLPPQQLRNLFLSWRPPPHWHPPPRIPSLLSLVSASLCLSPSLTLCSLCLLFVHLSVPLCACFRRSSASWPLQSPVCLSVFCALVPLSLLT